MAEVKKKITKKKVVKKVLKKEDFSLTNFLMGQVRKDFGKDAIMLMKEEGRSKIKPIVSTGYEGLDSALGIGGLPPGRIIEIYGPEASGKTTLTLHIASEFQKIGGQVAFLDSEHALDINYAESLGVNVEDLILNQPDNGEQVFDIIEALAKAKTGMLDELKTKDTPKEIIEFIKLESKKPLLMIVDSVAAMSPKAELEGTLEDGTSAGLGAHARLMSQGLRRLVGTVRQPEILVIFINQTRSKIGGYGDPTTTTGGNALKFYASIRLHITSFGKYEEGGELVGKEFKIKVVKNKVAPPFKLCTGLVRFGVGFDKIWPMFNLLKDKNVIKRGKKGWLVIPDYPNLTQFAGFKGFRKTYDDHKDIIDQLYKENK